MKLHTHYSIKICLKQEFYNNYYKLENRSGGHSLREMKSRKVFFVQIQSEAQCITPYLTLFYIRLHQNYPKFAESQSEALLAERILRGNSVVPIRTLRIDINPLRDFRYIATATRYATLEMLFHSSP